MAVTMTSRGRRYPAKGAADRPVEVRRHPPSRKRWPPRAARPSRFTRWLAQEGQGGVIPAHNESVGPAPPEPTRTSRTHDEDVRW